MAPLIIIWCPSVLASPAPENGYASLLAWTIIQSFPFWFAFGRQQMGCFDPVLCCSPLEFKPFMLFGAASEVHGHAKSVLPAISCAL